MKEVRPGRLARSIAGQEPGREDRRPLARRVVALLNRMLTRVLDAG